MVTFGNPLKTFEFNFKLEDLITGKRHSTTLVLVKPEKENTTTGM